MNKRSAMLVAAGLVLTLVVGGVAVAVGMTGPEASSAQPKLTQHKKNKPIVKTTKKTVTVHKKAKAQAGDRRDRAGHVDGHRVLVERRLGQLVRRQLLERQLRRRRTATTTTKRTASDERTLRGASDEEPSDEPSDDGGSGVEDD